MEDKENNVKVVCPTCGVLMLSSKEVYGVRSNLAMCRRCYDRMMTVRCAMCNKGIKRRKDRRRVYDVFCCSNKCVIMYKKTGPSASSASSLRKIRENVPMICSECKIIVKNRRDLRGMSTNQSFCRSCYDRKRHQKRLKMKIDVSSDAEAQMPTLKLEDRMSPQPVASQDKPVPGTSWSSMSKNTELFPMVCSICNITIKDRRDRRGVKSNQCFCRNCYDRQRKGNPKKKKKKKKVIAASSNVELQVQSLKLKDVSCRMLVPTADNSCNRTVGSKKKKKNKNKGQMICNMCKKIILFRKDLRGVRTNQSFCRSCYDKRRAKVRRIKKLMFKKIRYVRPEKRVRVKWRSPIPKKRNPAIRATVLPQCSMKSILSLQDSMFLKDHKHDEHNSSGFTVSNDITYRGGVIPPDFLRECSVIVVPLPFFASQECSEKNSSSKQRSIMPPCKRPEKGASVSKYGSRGDKSWEEDSDAESAVSAHSIHSSVSYGNYLDLYLASDSEMPGVSDSEQAQSVSDDQVRTVEKPNELLAEGRLDVCADVDQSPELVPLSEPTLFAVDCVSVDVETTHTDILMEAMPNVTEVTPTVVEALPPDLEAPPVVLEAPPIDLEAPAIDLEAPLIDLEATPTDRESILTDDGEATPTDVESTPTDFEVEATLIVGGEESPSKSKPGSPYKKKRSKTLSPAAKHIYTRKLQRVFSHLLTGSDVLSLCLAKNLISKTSLQDRLLKLLTKLNRVRNKQALKDLTSDMSTQTESECLNSLQVPSHTETNESHLGDGGSSGASCVISSLEIKCEDDAGEYGVGWGKSSSLNEQSGQNRSPEGETVLNGQQTNCPAGVIEQMAQGQHTSCMEDGYTPSRSSLENKKEIEDVKVEHKYEGVNIQIKEQNCLQTSQPASVP